MCPPSITYEDKVDRRVFAHRAQSLSEKTSTIGCSPCLLYTTKVSRTSLQQSHQTFDGLHVLGVRLLHPSRQFLHGELQLTPVLTEMAGPHRPRSVASSTLCLKLLAIFFISRPYTRSTHSFALVAQSHLCNQEFYVSRVGLELPSLASLCASRIQSQQSVHVGLLFSTSPISTLVPITAVVLTNKCFPTHLGMHYKATFVHSTSSPQRTNLTNVSNTFRYPTHMLHLPSDTPIKLITSSTFLSNAAPASLRRYIDFDSLWTLPSMVTNTALASGEWRW